MTRLTRSLRMSPAIFSVPGRRVLYMARLAARLNAVAAASARTGKVLNEPAMLMPAPDTRILARRTEIVAALRRILPADAVIDAEAARRAYESDGLTAYRQSPM